MKRFAESTRLAACISFVLLGPAAAGAVSAADEAAVTGTDAADYFFKQRGVSTQGHPWLGSSGETASKDADRMLLWQGENKSNLRATFKAQAAYFNQGNAWFGKDRENLGAESQDWWESAVTPGVEGSYFLPDSAEIYGRVSAVMASTDDIDAAGSNVSHGTDASDIQFEDAYAGWRSGDTFSSLGKDFLDISFGRQQYVAGTGFILHSESSNGKNRGGYWIGERHAAKYAGIVRLNTGNWKSDLIYLEADDNPESDTKVGGITLDYAISDKIGGVGGGFYQLDSDIETRDSMKVYDIRFNLSPFEAFDTAAVMKPLKFEGEYVYEDNDDKLQASGWYLSGSYGWDAVTWKPTVTYRYASFEGDDPDSSKSQDFDPLFYGFDDWGYWYQGEILGEYVLANSNLNSHMLKVNVAPTDDLSVNLFYYNFKVDNTDGFGVQSEDFADEWDVTVDWSATKHLSFSLVGAYVKPDDGAKEYTGGDDDWTYGMFYTSLSF